LKHHGLTRALKKKYVRPRLQPFRRITQKTITKIFLNYPYIFKFLLGGNRLVRNTISKLKLRVVVFRPIEIAQERTLYFVESSSNLKILPAGISRVETYLKSQLSSQEFHDFRVIRVHWNDKTFVVSNQRKSRRVWETRFRKAIQIWNPTRNDLIFFPSFSAYKALDNRDFQYIQEQCRIITNVFDVLPLTNPEWFMPHMVTSFKERFEIACKYSDLLVVNCNHTKNEIQRFIEANLHLKTWKCRISVVSLWDVASNLDLQVGTDKNNHQSVLDTFQSLEPLLILISTIEPRKGHIELIDASKNAWDAGARFNLVLIGQLGWVDAPTLNKFQNFLKEFESRAIWIETADDEFLARTLKSADLLVSPSLGEGFGLPVAEALKFSVPVLANAIPAYKEIFGNQAVFYGIDEEYSTLTSALCDIEGVIQNAENIVKTLPSDRPNTIDQLMRAFKEV